MKKHALSTVCMVSLLALLAAVSAYAYVSSTVIAKVPFSFSVGNESLPAGHYTLYQSSEGYVSLLGPQGSAFLGWTLPGRTVRPDGEPKIVFHRYGDQYFLSEIFSGTDNVSRKLPVSKLEKEHRASSPAVAENRQERDVVIFGTR